MTESGTHGDTIFSAIVPAGTATAEVFGEAPAAPLFPEEAAMVGNAVDKRRREFSAGRTVARQALHKLGYPAVPIISGPNREPLWPAGVVGSITHCAGYCAAALAASDALVSIGIDAEPHQSLPDDVLKLIASRDELGWIARQTDDDFCWDRLLFSAKESVYKTWFPLTHRWLDFTSAHVEFDKLHQTFYAALIGERFSDGRLSVKGFDGRYLVHGGLVLTAVAMPLAGNAARDD